MRSAMRLLLVVATAVAWACVASAQQAAGRRCPGSPNQCSLHGSCAINRQGEHVCNCQWGFHGHDCSKKMCPHGVNPTSAAKGDKKLRLVITAPASLRDLPASAASQYALRGKFILTFHAHSVELEAPLPELTSDACARVFRRFQNLAQVSCERVEFNAPASAVYEIALQAFPVYPVMNNLYRHDGNPTTRDFWCDASGVQVTKNGVPMGNAGSIQCAFQSVGDGDVKPYGPCSSHGLCNDATGICTCDDGYYGDNCANNKDEEDILVAPSLGPFFRGNVLRVSAKRGKSTEFNLIKADIGGATVFSMDGAGDTVFHEGSVYLKDGDLVVQDGQLRVHKGSSVLLESADLKVQNGNVHLVATDAADAATLSEPLLRLETASTSYAMDFLRVTKHSSILFRISSSGTLVAHEGGMEILKGGLKVHRGGLQVLTDGIEVMQGGLEVSNDNIQVREGNLHVQNGVVAVESSSPAQHVMALTSTAKATGPSASVLHVQAASQTTTLISASSSADGFASFQVLGSGETQIKSGGLKVAAGGVEIASGGQIIHSGGLVVKSGGINVESGTVTTRDGFSIQDGGLDVHNNHLNGPVLTLSSGHKHYSGSMLEIVVNQSTSDPPFRLLEAYSHDEGIPDSIFSVESDGSVRTRGDISTLNKGRIISAGALVSQAQVVFSHTKIEAGETIVIPSTHSYVKITNDGVSAANNVKLDSSSDAYAGQLLVIQNEDDEPLNGDVSVKPSAAAIFVFDGRMWRALTAASFDTSVITGVKSFEAANDLNFGEVKLTVNNLQVASQRAGYVALYGKGGDLTQDEQLKFDAVSGVLSVEKLEARSLSGHIDMSQSELRGVEIVGGHISNVNMTDIEMVEVSGELFVENQAYFGAGITVDGQVMGSGAYIDASDARFKQDIEPIGSEDALEMVKKLQGVEYAYRTEDFPTRHFSDRREVGFVAQEVERVLPQVVAEDADGFKYVAYARVVPVLVEAIKQANQETVELRGEVDRLAKEVEALRELLLETMASAKHTY